MIAFGIRQGRRSFGTKITAAMVKELRQVTGAPMMECKTALANDEVNGDMDKAIAWLRKNGVQTAEKKSGRETKAGLVGCAVRDGVAAIVEINSETDFVAKNESFAEMVDTILNTTLDAASLVTGAGPDIDREALLNAPVSTDDGDVRGVVTRAVATMRENIELRRAARLEFDPATEVVSSYVHNGAGSNCGTSVALVQLKSSGSVDGLDALAKQLAMHVVAVKPKYRTTDDVPEEAVNKEKEILAEEAIKSGKPADKVDMIVKGRLNKFFSETVLVKQGFVMDDKKSVEKILKEHGKKVRFHVLFLPFYCCVPEFTRCSTLWCCSPGRRFDRDPSFHPLRMRRGLKPTTPGREHTSINNPTRIINISLCDNGNPNQQVRFPYCLEFQFLITPLEATLWSGKQSAEMLFELLHANENNHHTWTHASPCRDKSVPQSTNTLIRDCLAEAIKHALVERSFAGRYGGLVHHTRLGHVERVARKCTNEPRTHCDAGVERQAFLQNVPGNKPATV